MSVPCQYNVSMYIQKAYKNGNSVVVTIPREYLRDVGIRDGSELIVDKDELGVITVVKKTQKVPAKKSNLTPEFKQWLDQALKEDAQILDELAER